jgi:hypothetical protein
MLRGTHVAALAALFLMSCSAASAHGVPEQLRRCGKEADDASRLACFDRELARLAEQPAAADEPVRARVTRVVERKDGTLVISLDNDQTWAQKSRGHLPVKVGEQVTLKGGAFSSTYLVTESGRTVQVKRVR